MIKEESLASCNNLCLIINRFILIAVCKNLNCLIIKYGIFQKHSQEFPILDYKYFNFPIGGVNSFKPALYS